MTSYVVGFLFTQDASRVALIRKSHPEWQRGRLNGIGGKIKPDETPADAMRREFFEEAGLDFGGWRHFVTLRGPQNGGWEVHFFEAAAPTNIVRSLRGQEDEEVVVTQVHHLGDADIIPNLRWLVPLALDPCVALADVAENGRGNA